MKGSLYFAYGIVCYVLFFAIFAYMAGFVGNLLVPKSIDSAPAACLPCAIGVNVLLIAMFGLQHSIMARPRFKRNWTRLVPPAIERSTYMLLSCVALAVLMWLWQGIDTIVWDVQQPIGRAMLWGLFGTGWLLVPASSLMIDHFDLFGIRQVWLYLRGREYTPRPFRTPMLYAYMRHPIYFGWALAFWATPTMSVGHLLFAGAMTAYMILAVRIEERDLVDHFGNEYMEYRRRVPMFIPGVGTARRRSAESSTVARFASDEVDRPSGGVQNVIDLRVLADPSWWHWTITVPLLAMYLAGIQLAIEAAILICAAMAFYYLIRLRRLRPFPVQIRLAYLAWLMAGLLPAMQWMHYVALVGTTAMVAFGYCPLACV